MEIQRSNIPPYGQHFLCAERMLKGTPYRVFARLIDEYSLGLVGPEHYDKLFTMPVSMIMYRTGGMDNETIKNALSTLQRANLIDIKTNGVIKVNAAYYIALVNVFNTLSKKDEKQFSKDLLSGRVDMFEKYNLEKISEEDADLTLKLMKGRKIREDSGNPLTLRKSDNSAEIRNISGNPLTLRKSDNSAEIRNISGNPLTLRKSVTTKEDLYEVIGILIAEIRYTQRKSVEFAEKLAQEYGITDSYDENPQLLNAIMVQHCLSEAAEIRNISGNPQFGQRKSATVNINNNIKYKTHIERSEIYKGGENKILAWFGKRDSSLPELSSTEFQTILEFPEQADTDSDKLIREVWANFQYDEENSSNNYLPASLVYEIICRSWCLLKEQDDNFQLSEEDARNIFGFDLIEQENDEPLCYITPSKLKNIAALSGHSQVSSREHKVSKREERILRRFFFECVMEIGEQDEDKLSNAELSVLALTQHDIYINMPQSNRNTTTSQFETIVQDVSYDCNIEPDKLRELWSGMVQKKGNQIVLDAKLIEPSRIFGYNHDIGDTDYLEKICLQRYEEYMQNDEADNG